MEIPKALDPVEADATVGLPDVLKDTKEFRGETTLIVDPADVPNAGAFSA